MPVPGNNIMYPNNEVKSIYEDVLREDSLSIEDGFDHNVK